MADKRNIPEILELDKSAFGGPSIVNVFPLPVCPYAKQVTFVPKNDAFTKGLTHES